MRWSREKGSRRGGIQGRQKIRVCPVLCPETGWGLQASACSSKSDRMEQAKQAEPTLTTKEQLCLLPVVGPSVQLWAGLPSARTGSSTTGQNIHL